MENKTYAKPMYKCAICGNTYDEIEERMHCERKCIKQKKEEMKKAAAEKKQAEQKARKAEVDAAINKASELLNKYVADYGKYSMKSDAQDSLFGDIFRMFL